MKIPLAAFQRFQPWIRLENQMRQSGADSGAEVRPGWSGGTLSKINDVEATETSCGRRTTRQSHMNLINSVHAGSSRDATRRRGWSSCSGHGWLITLTTVGAAVTALTHDRAPPSILRPRRALRAQSSVTLHHLSTSYATEKGPHARAAEGIPAPPYPPAMNILNSSNVKTRPRKAICVNINLTYVYV